MRNLVYVVVLTVFAVSCKTESDVNITYSKAVDFEVTTAVFIAIPAYIDTVFVSHSVDSVLSSMDLSWPNAKRVELTSLTLVANDSSGADMSFLSSVDLYIGNANSTSMLLSTSGDIQDADSLSVFMQSTTRDLREYFETDVFWLIPQVTTDETVLDNTTIRVEMEFLIQTD